MLINHLLISECPLLPNFKCIIKLYLLKDQHLQITFNYYYLAIMFASPDAL